MQFCFNFICLFSCDIASGLSELRNENDASCTYEGDNNVLVQQVSNWLFQLWYKRSDMNTFDTPLQSVLFLAQADNILNNRFYIDSVNDMKDPNGKTSSKNFFIEMTWFQNVLKLNFFINLIGSIKFSNNNAA